MEYCTTAQVAAKSDCLLLLDATAVNRSLNSTSVDYPLFISSSVVSSRGHCLFLVHNLARTNYGELWGVFPPEASCWWHWTESEFESTLSLLVMLDSWGVLWWAESLDDGQQTETEVIICVLKSSWSKVSVNSIGVSGCQTLTDRFLQLCQRSWPL